MLVSIVIYAPNTHAQTSDPYLNQLLSEANRQRQGAMNDVSNIVARDRQLRRACWQGDDDACEALDRMLRDPNIDPTGRYIQPPPGAYWPF